MLNSLNKIESNNKYVEYKDIGLRQLKACL